MSNQPVLKNLAKVLSGTFVLAIRTQGAHWNVTGPQFASLHELFEQQYTELFAAGDELAERLRALDTLAPGGIGPMLQLTDVDGEASDGDAMGMVADLAQCQGQVRGDIVAGIGICDDAGDEGTMDLLIARLQAHEKMIWMLQAHLQ